MELVRAIVLGVVQGAAEFLPISSSAHLILIPALFRWPDQGLAFDVALHAGTLLALVMYFWRDWARVAVALGGDLRHRRWGRELRSPDSRLALSIVIGTLPAATLGVAFDRWVEEHVREAWLVASTLALFGAVMVVVDRRARGHRGAEELTAFEALLIGCGQALALVPGVSRSGATIVAALLVGLRREEAARFSFLLGIPVIAGAVLLKARELPAAEAGLAGPLIGMAAAAVVGTLAIAWLLRFLRTRSLAPFAYYRWVIAGFALLVAALRAV